MQIIMNINNYLTANTIELTTNTIEIIHFRNRNIFLVSDKL